jgi:AcrR family transcriptional regulator
MHKKEELLQKISELFAKKGYEKTSIRDIAAHLGMTNAGLYYHFQNKQQMLIDIMNYAMEDGLANMRRELPHIKSAEERLAWIIRSQIKFYSENQSQTKALIQDRGALEASHAKIMSQKEEEYVGLVKEVVGQIIREHVDVPIPVEVATFCLLGMLNWLVHWYNPEGKVSPDELTSSITTIFLNGIKGRSD